jgi:uncharacterized protein (TIGR03663 family)
MSADSPADVPADRSQAFLPILNRSRAVRNAAALSLWFRWLTFVLLALIGLAIRLPQLSARPMHTDEAINAYILGQLLAGEAFTYDPQDRHGPALAAFALPLARIQGARTFSDLTESDLRLTSVLAGILTILLFGAAVGMFGFMQGAIAALLFAVAPLPAYYDRYFIHESLFIAATFALILSGWRASSKRNSVSRAALAGACAALMLACKETALLHFFALATAALVFWAWNLRRKDFRDCWRPKAMLAAATTSLLIGVALFTWFGRSWRALSAILPAVPQLLARAGGEGHQKPVWYYAQLLTGGWSGGLLLALACIGLWQTVRKRDPSPYGLLAPYFVLLAGIYSLIPYKTPWLALNLWLPLTLFAARATGALWHMSRRRLGLRVAIPVFAFLGAGAASLIAHDTRQRVFMHPAEETNPYAYAHTSEDLLGLPAEIEELARQNAMGAPRIAVIASDPWPLPWYLRKYSQVGFWQPGQQAGEADFYLTSTDAAEQYADRLRNYRPEFFGVRPGVLILLWSPSAK